MLKIFLILHIIFISLKNIFKKININEPLKLQKRVKDVFYKIFDLLFLT